MFYLDCHCYSVHNNTNRWIILYMGLLQGNYAIQTIFPGRVLPALAVPWCLVYFWRWPPLRRSFWRAFQEPEMLPLERFPEGNWTTIFEVQGTLHQEYVMCLDIFWCVFHYNNAITWAVPNKRVNSLRLLVHFFHNTQRKERKELSVCGTCLCFLSLLISLHLNFLSLYRSSLTFF